MSAYSKNAMPIHDTSFIGIPTEEKSKKYSLVMANSDGIITFIFAEGDRTQPCSSGQVFDIGVNCISISSLISVTMS